MLKNMKIGSKILLVMLITSLGALLLIALISFSQMLNLTKYSENANIMLGGTSSEESETALLNQAEEYLEKIVIEDAGYYNASLKEIGADVLAARDVIEKLYQEPDNYKGYLLPRPDETQEGVVCAKAFLAGGKEMDEETLKEFYLLSNAEVGLGPIYAHNPIMDNFYLGTTSGISYRYSPWSDYNPDYDPRERGWYQTTFSTDKNKETWLDTYTDAYGIVCVTCAAPFSGYTEETRGVIATDITMSTLTEDVLNTKIGQEGYAFLLDNNGLYIAHPHYLQEGFETDPSIGAAQDKLDCIAAMKQGKSGVAKVVIAGEDYYVAYAPISSTKWSLGITIPINEVIAPAVETKKTIDSYADETRGYIESTLQNVLVRFIILFAACTMLFVIFAFVLSNTITRPIERLTRSVIQIGHGNWDIKVDVEGKDEVGELGETFNNMTDELKRYVSDLTKVTAEKERIGAELDVARKIQASMLPSLFPPFPDRSEFDIYASMDPAKEVGGDFYDFFMIDNEHLALVIADVSGKGVPAALFMMMSKILLKNQTYVTLAPSEVLAAVNNQLCENNEAEMFVTIWLGIINVKTGIMKCANAGHEYPVIKRAGGAYELFKDPHGMVCAGMENLRYREYEIQFEKGDMLFVYTDGVPEATNAENELYGTDRLLISMNQHVSDDLKTLLFDIRKDVDDFVGEAPQFDDLTMLAFTYNGIEE